MKLKSIDTFWPSHNRHIRPQSSLKKAISCDVAIVGGGIIGALLAYELSKENLSIVLVDKREPGHGSTSASTALLLYELDVHLTELVKKIGKKKALRVYVLSLQAIGKLERLTKTLGIPNTFRQKKSLYVAFNAKDARFLKQEYALRKKHGFRVKLLEANDIKESFGMDAIAAIVSEDAGEIDPYRLTQVLLQKAEKKNVKIFGHTEATSIQYVKEGSILKTADADIHAKQVIMATGYESQQYIQKKIVALKSSYVIVSEPIPGLSKHWLHTHLLWETARPYLYIRTTNDHRIMVGGEDEEVINDKKRDALISKKAKILQKKFQKLVPDIPFKTAYAWAGTFGETKDGMGYIGSPKKWKKVQFALGFGGNGISFGIVAAEMITQMTLGKRCKDAALFSFHRGP